MLPFRGASTDWSNGSIGTSWNSTEGNAKPCPLLAGPSSVLSSTRDTDIREQLQHRMTKMMDWSTVIWGVADRGVTVQFELKKCQEGGINVYKYTLGGTKKGGVKFFPAVPGEKARGNNHELKYMKFCLSIRIEFLVRGWSRFPRRLWSPHPWRY